MALSKEMKELLERMESAGECAATILADEILDHVNEVGPDAVDLDAQIVAEPFLSWAQAVLGINSQQSTTTAKPSGRYHMYVETDWDFGLRFKGHAYTASSFSLLFDDVSELEEVEVLGPFGAPCDENTRCYEFQLALEQIRKNPDEFFSNTGGNRGVEWFPLPQGRS